MGNEEVKNKIGARIREFAEQKFRTSKSLAEAMGMLPQTLQLYISGRAFPGGEVIKKLAELGADVHYILTGEKLYEKLKDEIKKDMLLREGGIEYPVVTYVSAGPTIEFFINEATEKVAFNYHKHNGCMALRVKGDSMSPTIEDGDLVLVDSEAALFDGCIVAARLKTGEQVVKRFRRLPADLLQLTPDNLSYEPLTINKDQIDIILPVVKVQRDVFTSKKKGTCLTGKQG